MGLSQSDLHGRVPRHMCLQEEVLILERFQEEFKDKRLVVLAEFGDSCDPWAYSLKKLKGRCVRL
jgi:hypothetical protein